MPKLTKIPVQPRPITEGLMQHRPTIIINGSHMGTPSDLTVTVRLDDDRPTETVIAFTLEPATLRWLLELADDT